MTILIIISSTNKSEAKPVQKRDTSNNKCGDRAEGTRVTMSENLMKRRLGEILLGCDIAIQESQSVIDDYVSITLYLQVY